MYQKAYENRSCQAREKGKYMAWSTQVDRCLARTGEREQFDYRARQESAQDKQLGILKELLSHKGFGWDETRKMVVADGSLWNYYVKFRGRSVENYAAVCVIIGNDPIAAGYGDGGTDVDHLGWIGNERGGGHRVWK
ncbi:hypothetical protein Tsubulata_008856 [Turnera subulata]|uniref:Myb/SANT-like domain-containing protein n=1 Tax=Turnera subulata TaxID=218843 RepID=A0A9Q0F3Q5_9ROSI|nr:hypothetical protein Tsubulata_008856 [Turnera subulata]